ncbi:hypothetical protein C8Q79DRAFT_191894 [Trametes meyenii]|nr:hypothetical protein C8Q79DRAFT_191894 [Trametes meyenii]
MMPHRIAPPPAQSYTHSTRPMSEHPPHLEDRPRVLKTASRTPGPQKHVPGCNPAPGRTCQRAWAPAA